MSTPNPPPFTPWDRCLSALDDASLKLFEAWRGFSWEFCVYLRAERLLGLYQHPKTGIDYFCYPVFGPGGAVIAEQVFTQTANPNEPKAFMTAGAAGNLSPIMLGALPHAKYIFPAESPHDAFAYADKSERWKDPDACFIATRGAGNDKVLSGLPWPNGGSIPKVFLLGQNDSQVGSDGKTANERWLGKVGSIIPFPFWVWMPPQPHKDFNDWTRAGVTAQELAQSLTDLQQTAASAPGNQIPDWLYPRPTSSLPKDLPPQIIKGLLYRGARIVMGAGPKSKKSFLLLQLSYSVSNKLSFLGLSTQALGGKCLHIDLELFPAECKQRLLDIQKALGAGSIDNVEVIALRGKTRQLSPERFNQLSELIAQGNFVLTSFDPVYKLMPGRDERVGVDVQPILATLEEIGEAGNCSIAYNQHFAKGNQALKFAIDRISGSNYFTRDADVILTLTELREDDTFAVEIKQRSFPEIKAFGVRFTYPIFERDDSINVTEIRQPGKGKADNDPVTERMLTALHVADADGGLVYSDWFKAIQVKGKDGKFTPSETTFKRRLRNLTKPGGPVFKSALDDKYKLSPGYAQYRTNFNGQGSP